MSKTWKMYVPRVHMEVVDVSPLGVLEKALTELRKQGVRVLSPDELRYEVKPDLAKALAEDADALVPPYSLEHPMVNVAGMTFMGVYVVVGNANELEVWRRVQ